MLYRYGILFAGLFCCATSVIFIKLSAVDPVLLAAYRLLIAGVVLVPFFIHALKRHPGIFMQWYFKRTLWPGAFLGLHMILWTVGARLTPTVNSTLIVNIVPILMPFLLYFMAHEVINRTEATGTCVALSGVMLLGFYDYRLSAEYALGDSICLASMVLFAVYLTFARRNRDFVSIWFYIVPVYLWGGLLCLVMSLIGWMAVGWVDSPFRSYPLREIMLISGLALVPTVLGHTFINYALKHLRGQRVAIINSSQFILAGIMAYVLLQEVPEREFYLCSILIVSGAIIVIRAAPVHKKVNIKKSGIHPPSSRSRGTMSGMGKQERL